MVDVFCVWQTLENEYDVYTYFKIFKLNKKEQKILLCKTLSMSVIQIASIGSRHLWHR